MQQYSRDAVAASLGAMETSIPKIIHQSWRDAEVPAAWEASGKAWREIAEEEGWEYRFWTDKDNIEFLSEYYPWAKDFYEELGLGIQRSHLMRYFYMFHYGGVYVDMDVVPKPDRIMDLIDRISESYRVLLSTESHPNGGTYISTSWMMSVSGHPLWNTVIHKLVTGEDPSTWEKVCTSTFRHYEVIMRTGSWFLTDQWESYCEYLGNSELTSDVMVLPREWLRPGVGEHSNYVTLVEGGPTWRDWDSTVAQYGQLGWKYRDFILASLFFVLVLVLVLVLLR